MSVRPLAWLTQVSFLFTAEIITAFVGKSGKWPHPFSCSCFRALSGLLRHASCLVTECNVMCCCVVSRHLLSLTRGVRICNGTRPFG